MLSNLNDGGRFDIEIRKMLLFENYFLNLSLNIFPNINHFVTKIVGFSMVYSFDNEFMFTLLICIYCGGVSGTGLYKTLYNLNFQRNLFVYCII